MNSKRVQVEIAGMTFHVIGEEDDAYVKELAEEADRRIETLQSKNYRLNDVQLYILSLLNALDDMYKLDKSNREASALSSDAEGIKEKLKEIDELHGQLKERDSALDRVQNRLEAAHTSLKESEGAKKALEREKADLEKALSSARDDVSKKDEQIKALEEKNYETQMRLVDLNKEIYVLRGNDEQE